MLRKPRGFAMVELIAAAVIGALIAGGALMALVTALRIAQKGGGMGMGLITSMISQYHNFVACDHSPWFRQDTCEMNLPGDASAVTFPPSMQAQGSYRVNAFDQYTILLKAVVEIPSDEDI